MEKTEYVVGFLFSPSLDEVVLIRKNRPTWQAGKLNGVGGKIEPGETNHEAMVSEFREETGLDIPYWYQFCTLHDPTFELNVFFAAHLDYDRVVSKTDEKVNTFWVDTLMDTEFTDAIPNIKWMIQMAISMQHESSIQYQITIE